MLQDQMDIIWWTGIWKSRSLNPISTSPQYNGRKSESEKFKSKLIVSALFLSDFQGQMEHHRQAVL